MPDSQPDSSCSPPATVRHAERYQTLLDSIDEGFCVVEVIFDAAGTPIDYVFLEANRSFSQQTGLFDAVGKRMRALAPAHEQHWFATYGRVAMTGEPARFVHEAQALGDRWFDVYAFRTDAPESRHVAILFRDITARIQAERATQLLSDISQDLLEIGREEDLASAIGWRLAAFFGISRFAFAELDVARHELVMKEIWHRPGIPSAATMHQLGGSMNEAFWEQTLAGKTLAIGDVETDEHVRHPGRFRELQVGSLVSLPLRREHEWRHLFLLFRAHASEWAAEQLETARELASRYWTRLEQLRADQAVRASEERLRLLVENAREYAIFSTDLERRITSWNFGAERLLGFTESEMIGRSADLVFTPEDRIRGAPETEASLALSTGRAANERWHVRKDGSRFWGSGEMMAMQDPHGVVYGLLKIMRDQTAEQQAREALEASRRELLVALESTERARAEAVEAGRAKDRFLAALSHELRTPLSPALMIASEGSGNPALPPDVRADFEMVRKSIEVETRLIDDLLDLTRISRGKLSLKKEPVDVHERIHAARETLQTVADAKGIAVNIELAASRAQVVGDSGRLQQILLNLLSNAIKFTPAGGNVSIVTTDSADGARIVVRITDTGIGLTAGEMARIFEPFAQGRHADEKGSALYGGLGLGLAIVDELTARHGGRVTAESPGLGRGSTFSVELPLAHDDSAPGRAKTVAPATAAVPARQVLLVEDHEHTRAALQRMLQRRGHLVVTAGSRRDALAEARRRNFDLLISDIGLPDGDGYELLAELRTLRPELPGIALSGFGMESDVRRSNAAGFALHLVKPVSISKLEGAIVQLFSSNPPST